MASINIRSLWSNSINKLSKNAFTFDVLKLGGGIAFVQFIGVLCSPIITRLYTPADFGLMATFSSLLLIFSVLGTLRYEAAIPIVQDEHQAKQITLLAGGLSVLWGLGWILFFVIWGKTFSRLISDDVRFLKYLWFIPVGVIGSGLYASLNGWITRKSLFSKLSVSKIYQSLSSITVQLVFGFLKLGVIGLILGALASQCFGLGILWRSAKKEFSLRTIRDLFPGMLTTARTFYRYPIFIVWNALMNTASIQAPTLMISAFFGTQVTGLYSLGFRVIQMPIAIISASVAGVFLSRAAESYRSHKLDQLTFKVIQRLVIISTFPFLVLMFFAPLLFAFIFGSRWEEAGRYASYLCPWLYLLFTISPVTSVVLVLEKQAKDTIWQIVILATRIGSLALGIWLHDARITILLFGVTSFIIATIYFSWLLKGCSISLYKVLRFYLIEILFSLVLIVPCWLLTWYIGGKSWLILGLLIIISPIALFRGIKRWNTLEIGHL